MRSISLLIAALSLAAVLSSCCAPKSEVSSESDAQTTLHENDANAMIEPLTSDPESCDQLTRPLFDTRLAPQKDSEDRLIYDAESSKEARTVISNCLRRDLKSLCDSPDDSFDGFEFRKAKAFAEILARLKDPDALPIMVDCSGHDLSMISSYSSSNFATFEPITRYGEKALGLLKARYNNGDVTTKCQVVSIISDIGGSDAERFLRRSLTREMDPELRGCLTNCLLSLQNKRTP